MSGIQEEMPNQDPTWMRLPITQQDLEWIEWQQYLARRICSIFQITPQELGIVRVVESTAHTVDDDVKLLEGPKGECI